MQVDRTHAVQIPPRCFKPRLYFALRRRFKLTRKQSLQVMWYGGEAAIAYEDDARG